MKFLNYIVFGALVFFCFINSNEAKDAKLKNCSELHKKMPGLLNIQDINATDQAACKKECNELQKKNEATQNGTCRDEKTATGVATAAFCTQGKDKKSRCLCGFKCASEADEYKALLDELKEDHKFKGPELHCVNTTKMKKNEALKLLCNNTAEAQVARNYCLEGLNGTRFFCDKPNQCFIGEGKTDGLCVGCLQYTCRKGTTVKSEEKFTLPKEWAAKVKDAKKPYVGLNLDDDKTVKRPGKECTDMEPDKDIEVKCKMHCVEFGNKKCGGEDNRLDTGFSLSTLHGEDEKSNKHSCCCNPGCQ